MARPPVAGHRAQAAPHHVVRPFPGRNFAKPIRKTGAPVSSSPDSPRYIEPPPVRDGIDPSLTFSIETVLPGLTAAARAAGQLVFHSVGDTGGVKGETTQMAIAEAMVGQITAGGNGVKPSFFYHLGDVVYFNGQSEGYLEQFYEPYQYYPGPIFAIPGNHDGDTAVRRNDPPDNEPSLYGFMANFCASQTSNSFKYRTPMDQPYCYWEFAVPFLRIIGLYSNVDGTLDAEGQRDQWDWFVERLKAAPADKWLIVAIHHPCYSLDSAHGGYQDTLDLLDAAFASAERRPDIILSGHVHNYQRFSRAVDGANVPYIVAGAGGYADSARSLHKLQKGLENEELPFQTTLPDVKLEAFDQENSGFLRLTATPSTLTADYFAVPFNNPAPVQPADSVTVNAGTQKSA